MATPVAPRGEFATASFAELLWGLHESRLTGTLSVRRSQFEKTVYFEDGRVTFARSNNPDDRLGEFLLKRGTIGLDAFLESALRIGPGRRQGVILCEIGAVSPDDLVKWVTEQVTEILYSLFPWLDGEYEVGHGAADTSERIVLSIPIEDVILRGMRRVGDWSRIWGGIGADAVQVFSPRPKAGSLSYREALTEQESHVLGLVNGKLSLARILELSYTSNFETCRILWALKLIGAIGAEGAAGDADDEDYDLAEVIEQHDRVFSFVHGFVTERIGDLVDHFMDRTMVEAVRRHPRALREVHLRNQGRVEYEQIFANLAGEGKAARHQQAKAALREVLELLLGMTGRELGPEEEGFLRDQLRLLARDAPRVPVDEVLSPKASDPAL